MSAPLITINEKSTLQDALHKMRDNNIRKLPVISKKNQIMGIIFQSTIANCNTKPKFPKIAFTGGLSSLGAVDVAFLITFAIVD